jgi:predicted RNase H-like HicB family nuclease
MGQFLVAITKEDDFFIARCPELNVTSQGETLEEAEENIKEAIELYIESFVKIKFFGIHPAFGR